MSAEWLSAVTDPYVLLAVVLCPRGIYIGSKIQMTILTMAGRMILFLQKLLRISPVSPIRIITNVKVILSVFNPGDFAAAQDAALEVDSDEAVLTGSIMTDVDRERSRLQERTVSVG